MFRSCSVRTAAPARRILALFALLLVAGCELVAPPLPDTAVELTPPPVYARWWRMVEGCSGLRGSMAAVRWYEVPGASSVDVNGESASGYWTKAGNRIVLAGAYRMRGDVVRHEMLHALLRGGGHPRQQFVGACAGVVHCGPQCIEGTFTPLAGAVPVDPRELELRVEVVPAQPNLLVDGGYFSVIVTARNPGTRPVRISALDVRGRPTSAWGYEIGSDVWGSDIRHFEPMDPSVHWFAAGEAKQQVFDFHLDGAGSLPGLNAGAYVVRGAYARRFTAGLPVMLGP